MGQAFPCIDPFFRCWFSILFGYSPFAIFFGKLRIYHKNPSSSATTRSPGLMTTLSMAMGTLIIPSMPTLLVVRALTPRQKMGRSMACSALTSVMQPSMMTPATPFFLIGIAYQFSQRRSVIFIAGIDTKHIPRLHHIDGLMDCNRIHMSS